jgi:hypothetical protein
MTELINVYPLSWPITKPRSRGVNESDFGARNIGAAVDEVLRQLRLLGATHIVISSNLRLRSDGLPLANQAQPTDRGVAVYFKIDKEPRVIACDRWSRVQDNLWAIAKDIDATRGKLRWGASTLHEAFAGYAALPQPAKADDWWVVLGLPRNTTRDRINERWRELARTHHPDAGGSDAMMATINAARDEGLKQIEER